MKQIHWYPGHIDKTIRELEQTTKKIDIIILLLDARAPFSSFLPYFKKIIKNKNLLIILTKSDLTDKTSLNKAKETLSKDYEVITLNLKQINNKTINGVFSKLDTFKIKSLIPKVMIVGVPNVGKSTIINFLSKQKKAKAEDKAGVTKKTTWFKIGKYHLLDTPGVLEPRVDDINTNYHLAALGSLKQSILPIEELGKYVLQYLILEKKYNSWPKDFEQNLQNYIDTKKITKEQFYKKLLRDFQNGFLGLVYLDNFYLDFELDNLIENN